VPPEPASFSTGDPPHHESTPDSRARGASAPLAPAFPDLSSLRKSWHTQFNNIPAIPAPSLGEDTRHGATPSLGNHADQLPELPPMRTMASLVSSSLQDHQDQAHETSTTLTPLPAEKSISRHLKGQESEHSWEPDISHQTPQDNTAIGFPQLEEMTSSEDSPQESSNLQIKSESPPQKPAATTDKSPFIAADLVAKIRSNKTPSEDASSETTPFDRTPFDNIPVQEHEPTETHTPSSLNKPPSHSGYTQTNIPFAETQPLKTAESKASKFTDKDLQDALRPLIEPSIDHFLYAPTHSIHGYLEPMLRSTVRRAIAEQMTEASPFRDISGWDKFAWKLRALMSSRTYDDVLFNQTRRYQVEEVYLLRPQTRSLISYASHNPARHAKSAKVEGTVRKIATKAANTTLDEGCMIKWEDDRQLVIRPGKHTILAAIVHGSPNTVLQSDLDYVLSQVEDRLGKSLEDNNEVHLRILQPMLECCLLIQSLASPN
jgi:hypothetical protein